jgi:hypothetical protein
MFKVQKGYRKRKERERERERERICAFMRDRDRYTQSMRNWKWLRAKAYDGSHTEKKSA